MEDLVCPHCQKAFKIDETGYANIVEQVRNNEFEKSLNVLGASPDESFSEIKKKYRRLAMKHHPDKVQAQGVSPELIAISEARFKEIQHAFDIVEKRLN